VVLGLRDILDAPDVVRRRWAEEGAFDAVEEFYDEVLVYGRREVFDIATEYAWPGSLASRLSYCGYVTEPHTSVGKPMRKRHQRFVEGAPLVLVVAGGGADAYPMFTSVMRSVRSVHAETGARFLMVTGPFMPERHVRTLKRRAADLPVTVSTTIKNSMAYMAAADLVVAMAGYNTTMEVLNAGTKGLLIPRRGPSAEQRTRARLFADHGWVRWLDPDTIDPYVITDAIADALIEPKETAIAPDLRGRELAVDRLVSHSGLGPQDLELELELERVAG
jgi:predicted glycosyltransferase